MMRSTTSGDLFWLSFRRASKRVIGIRMPTVPVAMCRAASSSICRLTGFGQPLLEVVD